MQSAYLIVSLYCTKSASNEVADMENRFLKRYGWLTKVAEGENLNQIYSQNPAYVTRVLQDLEKQLEASEPLYERAGSGVRLTRMGEHLIDDIRALLTLQRQIEEKAKQDLSNKRLVIGITSPTLYALVLRSIDPRSVGHDWYQETESVMDYCEIMFCREVEYVFDTLQNLIDNKDVAVIFTDLEVRETDPLPVIWDSVFNLGSTFLRFWGEQSLKHNFPQSLDGRYLIVPDGENEVKNTLERWAKRNGLSCKIIALNVDPVARLRGAIKQRGIYVDRADALDFPQRVRRVVQPLDQFSGDVAPTEVVYDHLADVEDARVSRTALLKRNPDVKTKKHLEMLQEEFEHLFPVARGFKPNNEQRHSSLWLPLRKIKQKRELLYLRPGHPSDSGARQRSRALERE